MRCGQSTRSGKSPHFLFWLGVSWVCRHHRWQRPITQRRPHLLQTILRIVARAAWKLPFGTSRSWICALRSLGAQLTDENESSQHPRASQAIASTLQIPTPGPIQYTSPCIPFQLRSDYRSNDRDTHEDLNAAIVCRRGDVMDCINSCGLFKLAVP